MKKLKLIKVPKDEKHLIKHSVKDFLLENEMRHIIGGSYIDTCQSVDCERYIPSSGACGGRYTCSQVVL